MTEAEQITELFKETVALARKVFNGYLLTMLTITALLSLDYLAGGSFIVDSTSLKIFGLEIPRIAFSAAFSLGFLFFIFWIAHISNVLHEVSDSQLEVKQNLRLMPEFKLWLLGPCSEKLFNRVLLWGMVCYGLFILVVISVVHLGEYFPPKEDVMPIFAYKAIGIVPLAVFLWSSYLLDARIFPIWNRLASQLERKSSS